MGVKYLWKILNGKTTTPFGQKLAIDTSIWIHYYKNVDESHFKYLTIMRILKLLHHKNLPVFVFDGKTPALKKRTMIQRSKDKLMNEIVTSAQRYLRNDVCKKCGIPINECEHADIVNKKEIDNMDKKAIDKIIKSRPKRWGDEYDESDFICEEEAFEALSGKKKLEFLLNMRSKCYMTTDNYDGDMEKFGQIQIENMRKRKLINSMILSLENNEGKRVMSDCDRRILFKCDEKSQIEGYIEKDQYSMPNKKLNNQNKTHDDELNDIFKDDDEINNYNINESELLKDQENSFEIYQDYEIKKTNYFDNNWQPKQTVDEQKNKYQEINTTKIAKDIKIDSLNRKRYLNEKIKCNNKTISENQITLTRREKHISDKNVDFISINNEEVLKNKFYGPINISEKKEELEIKKTEKDTNKSKTNNKNNFNENIIKQNTETDLLYKQLPIEINESKNDTHIEILRDFTGGTENTNELKYNESKYFNIKHVERNELNDKDNKNENIELLFDIKENEYENMASINLPANEYKIDEPDRTKNEYKTVYFNENEMIEKDNIDNKIIILENKEDEKNNHESEINMLNQEFSSQINILTKKIKEILSAFDIPFIDSPFEADSQCAYLSDINLVDAVVTEDNDVFLYGAKKVYRNYFRRNKQIKQYDIKEIEEKLTRDEMIKISLLVGSDYTIGREGFGIKKAIDYVKEGNISDDEIKDLKNLYYNPIVKSVSKICWNKLNTSKVVNYLEENNISPVNKNEIMFLLEKIVKKKE